MYMNYSKIILYVFCYLAEPYIEIVRPDESSEVLFPLIIPSDQTADLCRLDFLVTTVIHNSCKQTGTII